MHQRRHRGRRRINILRLRQGHHNHIRRHRHRSQPQTRRQCHRTRSLSLLTREGSIKILQPRHRDVRHSQGLRMCLAHRQGQRTTDMICRRHRRGIVYRRVRPEPRQRREQRCRRQHRQGRHLTMPTTGESMDPRHPLGQHQVILPHIWHHHDVAPMLSPLPQHEA